MAGRKRREKAGATYAKRFHKEHTHVHAVRVIVERYVYTYIYIYTDTQTLFSSSFSFYIRRGESSGERRGKFPRESRRRSAIFRRVSKTLSLSLSVCVRVCVFLRQTDTVKRFGRRDCYPSDPRGEFS